MLLQRLLRAPMRAWYAQMLTHAPWVPSPRAASFVGATSPEADRVLLIGNGPVHGWGVLTHDLSLVGRLGAALTSRTGRSVGVEFVGDERMTARSATAWTGDRAGEGFDLVIVAIGLNDALRLTPIEQFTADYRALVDHISNGLSAHAGLVFVTVPHASRYRMAQGLFGRFAERHATQLTAAIRAVASEYPLAHVVEAPQEHFEPAAPLGSTSFFVDLAEQLADSVEPHLERARNSRTQDPREFAPSRLRQLAAEGDEELDALAETARTQFGLSVAAVNLVEDDRVWSAATAGALPPQLPLSLVYCSVVMATNDIFIVPDRHRDPRFNGNPVLDVIELPFYTGLPLHDGNGAVVGALCLLDDHGRPADSIPLEEARTIVRAIEARLDVRLKDIERRRTDQLV